jgi:hypothetical protein
MRPPGVVVLDVLAEHPVKVLFVGTIMWSKHSRRSVPITRSTMALAFGARTGVSTAWIPIAAAFGTNCLP